MTPIQLKNESLKTEWQEALASIYGEEDKGLAELTNKAWDDWCYFAEDNDLPHPMVQLGIQ